GQHLVEPETRGGDELLFRGRARRADRADDAAAIGGYRGGRFARQAALQLRAPVSRVDDMRVRIDEAGNDAAAARVDARGAFADLDRIGQLACGADPGDASFEGGDDAVVKRGDVALGE